MLTTKFENIPSSLRVRPQWVAWKAVPYTTKDGKAKINKIPIDAKTGLGAKTDDFTTWISFDQAVAHAQTNGLAGVGFVFSDMDTFTGIDFDNCVDAQGKIHPEVEGYLRRLNSYAETSPSGNGIKVFVKAKFPLTAGNKIEKAGYEAECYNTKRYFTVTGHRLENYPANVMESAEAQKIYTEIFGKPVVTAKPMTGAVAKIAVTPTNPTDEAQRIREALEFIDPNDYETWLHMGFALKWWSGQGGGDQAKTIWDEWSEKSGKFQQGANDYQWNQFDAAGPITTDQATGVQTTRVITLGTLFKLARDNGWIDSKLPSVVLPPGGGSINTVGIKLGDLLAATGTIFVRGSVIVECGDDDKGETILKPVNPARATSLFEEVAALKTKNGKTGELALAICHKSMAESILSSHRFLEKLPPIKLITPCPVLVVRPDGTLQEVASYDIGSGVMAGGQPTIPCTLEEAIAVLQEVIADFDFVSVGDHARALASMITPALVFGGLIAGRAPIDVTEANLSQSGKGFRNKLTAAIYGLTVVTVNKKTTGGVGSMEETFDTHLVSGKPFISFDNVRGVLDSQKIESFCTEDSYSARIPHCQAVTIDPRRTILMLTSNKAEMEVDLINRSCVTRIRKRQRSYRYKNYPEGDILAHVRANQAKFLGAVHTVVKEWFGEGCPRSEVRQHDFADWGGSLDWIVQNLLGVAPLLDDHAAVQQRVTNPYLNWLRDVALAVVTAVQDNKPLTTTQIIDILERYSPQALSDFMKAGDKLTDEETHSRVLKAAGKRLGTFFNLDQCCVDVDVHVVCREEVMVEKPGSTVTKRTRRYTFSRTPNPGDAKTPINPDPILTERSKTPINPNDPNELEILHKENLNNNSSSTNPAPVGIIGNLLGFNGISQNTNGVSQGIPPKLLPLPSGLPAGGGLIVPPPPNPIVKNLETLEEFKRNFSSDQPATEPNEAIHQSNQTSKGKS